MRICVNCVLFKFVLIDEAVLEHERLLTVKHGEKLESLRNNENVEHEPCMNKYDACETSTLIKGKAELEPKYAFLGNTRFNFPAIDGISNDYVRYYQTPQAQASSSTQTSSKKSSKNKNKNKKSKRNKNVGDSANNNNNHNDNINNNNNNNNNESNTKNINDSDQYITFPNGEEANNMEAQLTQLNESQFILHSVDCGLVTNFRDHMPKPIKFQNMSPVVIVVTSVRVIPKMKDENQFYEHISVRTHFHEVYLSIFMQYVLHICKFDFSVCSNYSDMSVCIRFFLSFVIDNYQFFLSYFSVANNSGFVFRN